MYQVRIQERQREREREREIRKEADCIADELVDWVFHKSDHPWPELVDTKFNQKGQYKANACRARKREIER